MVNNNNLIAQIENKKPVELVQELKDEYQVPSFEEFMKGYEGDEAVSKNYQDEFDSYGDIRINRSYGPGNSQSSEENVAKAGRFVTGTFLTVATIACPPAGLTAAATLSVAGPVIKGVTRLADEDSAVRAVGDGFD